jgi:predicted kinase
MNMKRLILLKGLPACGKSTYAKKLLNEEGGKYKRINKDDLRAMFDNNQWTKSNEKFVLRMRDQLVLAALEEGKHVIVDDTNLHPRHELRLSELVKGKAVLEIVDMTDVTPEVCIERDLKRQNSVGSKVIWSMFNQFLKPKNEKEIASKLLDQSDSLPKAIICDLDGTLAKMNGRNPFDASKCDEDLVNIPVRNVVQNFYDKGYEIFFFTGREHKFLAPTLTFLEKAFADRLEYKLHMRKTKDMRKDSLIKREMFDDLIDNKYYVEFILDDRNQVVDMWRELGLVCLQVDYGDF